MEEERPKVSLMFDVFRAAERYESAMRRALRGQPVTFLGYGILSLLSSEGPQTPSAVAETLGTAKSSLTTPIGDLERAGLVERRPSAKDRRSHELVLTRAGTACHAELRRAMRRVLDPNDTPDLDVERLRADLATLIGYLDARIAAVD